MSELTWQEQKIQRLEADLAQAWARIRELEAAQVPRIAHPSRRMGIADGHVK